MSQTPNNNKYLVIRHNIKKNTEFSDASIYYSLARNNYSETPIGHETIILQSGTKEEKYKTGFLKSIERVDYNAESDNRLTDEEKKRFLNKKVWKFCIELKDFNVNITNEMKRVQYPRII
jgi:hypothetical protein